jgi:hypothetical protein
MNQAVIECGGIGPAQAEGIGLAEGNVIAGILIQERIAKMPAASGDGCRCGRPTSDPLAGARGYTVYCGSMALAACHAVVSREGWRPHSEM